MVVKFHLKQVLLPTLLMLTIINHTDARGQSLVRDALVNAGVSLTVSLATMYAAVKLIQKQGWFSTPPTTLEAKFFEATDPNWESDVDPFDQVAGSSQVKTQLKQVAELFTKRLNYTKIGAQAPKGMLLVGPPGNGKTSLARAFANSAHCRFLAIKGPDLLAERYFGTGVQKVNSLFNAARKMSPVVLFIDEIDAFGARSDSGDRGDVHALNTLLAQLDGFDQEGQIFVIGATNRPEVLDPALKRSGRLDLQVYVPMPNLEVREQILKIHSTNVKLAKDVDLVDLATKTGGFSGADLKNLINQAALKAVELGHTVVQVADFTAALSTVSVGRHMDPKSKLTFADVVGATEAKLELGQLVDYLKNPTKYHQLNARPARGILLAGSAGNGKSMLARALAGEANCAFYSRSATDFNPKLFYDGAERLKTLFQEVRQNGPAVIFLDDLELLNGQSLNELIVQVDGLAKSDVIVIGAVTKLNQVDPGLVRSGRLERLVWVPELRKADRHQLLEKLIESKWLTGQFDLAALARRTFMFSGADLVELVNSAKLEAIQDGRTGLEITDFNEALNRLRMGRTDRNLKQSAQDLKITAYHEAGHALVALLKPTISMPVEMISLIPRHRVGGSSLGVTLYEPSEDQYNYNESELVVKIQRALGGKVAEELVFGVSSSGVSSDLEAAMKIVTHMVCHYGMSKLGPLSIDKNNGKAQEEIVKVINECHQKTRQLLSDNIDLLHKLAQALLEKEELTSDEIYQITALRKPDFLQS